MSAARPTLSARLRALGLNLLLTAASLAVFFGLAEGLARVAGYAPYPSQSDVFAADFAQQDRAQQNLFQASPSRVWDLVPGYTGHRTDWGDRNWVTLTVNLQGRRDAEVSLAKPAGMRRIAILGDSVAFGARVLVQDDFASRLQAGLNAGPAPHYEVLNFGTPGYGTWQEVSMLREKALAYSPDLVLLVVVMNDLSDNNQAGRLGYLNMTRIQGAARFLRENSAFYRFMRERILSVEAQAAMRDPCAGADQAYCWETTEGQLDQFVALTREHSVPLVIVVMPVRPQASQPPDESLKAKYQDKLAEFAQAHGVPEIDLLEAFADNGGDSLFVDDYHPNEAGHALIARELQQGLTRLGLLPAP